MLFRRGILGGKKNTESQIEGKMHALTAKRIVKYHYSPRQQRERVCLAASAIPNGIVEIEYAGISSVFGPKAF